MGKVSRYLLFGLILGSRVLTHIVPYILFRWREWFSGELVGVLDGSGWLNLITSLVHFNINNKTNYNI